MRTTDLPGLHLLGAPSEGHVGITGAGAVPFLLLDGGDEGVGLAVFPLAAPVVKHLFDELVVLLQQQFGLRKAHQLRNTNRSYIFDKRDAFKKDARTSDLMVGSPHSDCFTRNGFKFVLSAI